MKNKNFRNLVLLLILFFSFQISNAQMVLSDGSRVNVNSGTTVIQSGNVTINSGAIFELSGNMTVTGTFTNSAGTSGFVLKSDATGTGSLIESSGINATIEKYIAEDIYHYLSSPVNDQALTIFTNTGTAHADFDLFYYREACNFGGGPAWINAGNTTSDILEVGLGYAYAYTKSGNSDTTLSFSGTTNTGTITKPITYTYNADISTDTSYFGWNFVGNPYPSRINATTFINDNSNIYGTLYFWDEAGAIEYSDYATWNISGGVAGGGGNPPNGFIDVGQAFMVHTTTTSTSVSFNNNMRVHNTAQFFKENKDIKRFKISVENEEGYYNETLIAFLEGTTNGFDNKYDGLKPKLNSNIALYTKLVENDGYDYAIQGLPPLSNGGVTVKLGIDAGTEGIYSFNVVNIENFHDTTSIFLEDLINNISVNLRKTSEYTFNVNETGSITDRFLLHFNTSAVGINEPGSINNQIKVYTHNDIIYIENNDPFGDIYVEIYNTFGQQLIFRKLDNKNKNEIPVNAGRGIYIARVFSEEQVFTAKVYLGDCLLSIDY